MKQEDENGAAGNPFDENAGFEDMKQEDESGGAGNPLDENAVFQDMKQDENQEPVTLSMKMPFLKI